MSSAGLLRKVKSAFSFIVRLRVLGLWLMIEDFGLYHSPNLTGVPLSANIMFSDPSHVHYIQTQKYVLHLDNQSQKLKQFPLSSFPSQLVQRIL